MYWDKFENNSRMKKREFFSENVDKKNGKSNNIESWPDNYFSPFSYNLNFKITFCGHFKSGQSSLFLFQQTNIVQNLSGICVHIGIVTELNGFRPRYWTKAVIIYDDPNSKYLLSSAFDMIHYRNHCAPTIGREIADTLIYIVDHNNHLQWMPRTRVFSIWSRVLTSSSNQNNPSQ